MIIRSLIFLLLTACCALAQLVNGSMVGVVTDTSGSLIPKAKLTISAAATGSTRAATADDGGNFVVSALAPGLYTVIVEHEGFKKLEKRNLLVNPNETLAVGELRLEVGQTAESITVSASGESVQTASSERSGMITNDQVENLAVINRDFAALVSLLPGVVENPGAETQGFGGNSTFNVQGARTTSNSMVIDGMPVTQPNGTNTGTFTSMDSVAAVRLTVSTYSAEFGRKPGASIQAITKGGTKQFHGAAYWYKRHEMFNANSFFNNRSAIPEAVYRYTTAGFNLGGPLFLPGLFNRDRKKVFFFFSTEQLREARPQAIRQLTTASAAERKGDFSDSRDLNAALIVVRDPATKVPYPGNIVPAASINKNGQNYLNLLPLPNYDNLAVSARRYNFQVQESMLIPKHSETLRIDLPLSANTNVYGRFNNWYEKISGWASPGGNSNWGWLPSSYTNASRSLVLSGSHILSPSVILELSGSFLRWTELAAPLDQGDMDRLNRKTSGVGIAQLYPENNPLNLVPNALFGGLNNPISTAIEPRFPLGGVNVVYTANAGITKTTGSHIMKAGAWLENWDVNKVGNGNFNGQLNFGRSANNPFDSNHPFANALLGNFTAYTESTTRPKYYAVTTAVEWFAQDTWKATRRLNLDFGVRFAWSQPYHNPDRLEAGFVPQFFDPSKTVKLIQPALVGTARMGRDPVSGTIYPAVYIGAVAPNAGDPFNGTVDLRKNSSHPAGMMNNSGIRTAPRIGFAWDPFGKGKTALRGGWGLFYEVMERTLSIASNPPLKLDPIVYNGNIADFTQTTGANFPTDTLGYNVKRPLGRVMNLSFGLQQSVGFGTVVDVSYAGALSRHLLQRRNVNAVPLGATFLPENQDPTLAGRPLPTAFLRPYIGYNDINYFEYDGSASYHSLQATANRRFSRGMQFGVAWTWSKAMDYADGDSANVSTLIDRRIWNYGKAGFDRTHIVKLNWTYDVPRASRRWNNAFSRYVLDGWQISGIASFISGAPSGIGLGLTSTLDITGSPTDSARVVVLSNPILPKSERTFERNFNTEAFGVPAQGSVGNAPKDVIRGPGINNFDISLFKNFRLPGDRFKLQFRGEGYNAWNHTQFSALDTATRFDAQGRQTNARLGEYTAARNSRRIQLALRLNF